MKSKLKATGIFFGVLFLMGGIINFVDCMIMGRSIVAALSDFGTFQSLLIIAALMFASAYLSFLAWLQPVLFLVMTPLPLMSNPNSFFGLGFFAIAIILLFKMDFYTKHRTLKVACSIGYILIIETYSCIKGGSRFYSALTPVFYIVAFLVFFYFAFRDRIFVYLKEPKEKLSLESKGLADAEQLYIHAIVSGKSVKEIAFEHSVSESTVRNTVSRAYRKLGLSGKSDLATLAEKYDIVQ